jgi:hypothetical protein
MSSIKNFFKQSTKQSTKPSIEPSTKPSIEKHEFLSKLYADMTDINFLRAKTPEEIKILNDEFKSKLETFKTNYGSQAEYEDSIKKFEKKIKEAENKKLTLELFNEPTKFDEEIITKNLSDISGTITNVLMSDDSNDERYLFTANYLNKPCFIKAFFVSEDNDSYYMNKKYIVI